MKLSSIACSIVPLSEVAIGLSAVRIRRQRTQSVKSLVILERVGADKLVEYGG